MSVGGSIDNETDGCRESDQCRHTWPMGPVLGLKL